MLSWWIDVPSLCAGSKTLFAGSSCNDVVTVRGMGQVALALRL